MLTNHRHELFAQGIAKGLPASQAYIQAGYKARGNAAESSASKLLRNPKVSQRIAEIADELKANAIADAREVQEFLTAAMRGQLTEELLTREGSLVTAKPQIKDRVRAGELLGRAQGIFLPTAAGDDGELAAIAEALAEAARQPFN